MVAILVMLGLAALCLLGLASQTFGVIWSDGSDDSFTLRTLITGTLAVKIDVTLGAGTVTDQLVDIGFDVTTMKGVAISVEDNAATTVIIHGNDVGGGSPIWTLTFPAGGGKLFWSSDFPAEVLNPFKALSTTDVTSLYLTKTGADTPTVRIRVFN